MNAFKRHSINYIIRTGYDFSDFKHTKAYKRAIKKQKSVGAKISHGAALNYTAQYFIEFNTVSGKVGYPFGLTEDHLEVIDVHFPCSQFFYSASFQAYTPGYVKRSIKRCRSQDAMEVARESTYKAWKKIKRFLLQPRGRGRPLEDPVLVMGDSDSFVYFMKDAENAQIKIGFSRNPALRRQCLEYEFGRKNMTIEFVASYVGMDYEKRIHNHFREFLTYRREWFVAAPEIEKFIKSLKNGSKLEDLLS